MKYDTPQGEFYKHYCSADGAFCFQLPLDDQLCFSVYLPNEKIRGRNFEVNYCPYCGYSVNKDDLP